MEPTDMSKRREPAHTLEERRRRRHEARAGATYREFLQLAAAELGAPEPQTERVVAAVLRALEQRLPFDEMAHLASQLPYKLRELLASCDEPSRELAPRDIGHAEFLALVARELDSDPDAVEAQVRAVFRVLTQTVSRGEIEEVIHLLPRRLRGLWPPLA